MYYIYILLSRKGSRTYVGFCENLAKRLRDHNYGKVRATRNWRPLRILYSEKFKTIKEAKHRERYWKSGGGRRKLKQFFNSGFPPT